MMTFKDEKPALACYPSDDGEALFCVRNSRKPGEQSDPSQDDELVMEVIVVDEKRSLTVKINPNMKSLPGEPGIDETAEQFDEANSEGETQ
ncbi:MAG TPA: hypothetical protein PLV96_06220 [Methanoregulaceae archaeon]|nr:hypothetical protein [Methanoregulaceae archaeon]